MELYERQGRYRSSRKKEYDKYRRDSAVRARLRMKDDALRHYGLGELKCQCPGCNETHMHFLTLDHINGGGSTERKESGRGGASIYNWLYNRGYPTGFQVLCWNCNSGRYLNGGVCPHIQPAIPDFVKRLDVYSGRPTGDRR